MQEIQNLNKAELEKLLKDLKTYKNLVKQVGNRWKIIYDNLFNWKNECKVEYYWDIEESFVFGEAKEIYKKVFNLDVSESDIKIIKNDKIKWWLKIYLNDNLVDLSFLKFYNLLNK